MMTTVHSSINKGFVQYTKGAPDVVLSVCKQALVNGRRIPMTDEVKEQILAQNKEMADKALRVLAVAMKVYNELPEDTSAQSLEKIFAISVLQE